MYIYEINFCDIINLNITSKIEFDRTISFSDVQEIVLSPYKEKKKKKNTVKITVFQTLDCTLLGVV